MRQPGFTAPGLLIFVVLLLIGMTGLPVAAQQAATPAVGTPEVVEIQTVETPAQPTAAPAVTAAPVGTPAPAAETDVVALVFWYQNPVDQDIIELYPLATDPGFVAGPAPGAASVGTVDFPVDGIPTIVVGDTTFETYPRPDGVIERWTWLDDFEGARPGTLVMQLAGLDGTYQNYFGTATFVSRDEGGSGGVLTIALRPPSPAAAAGQATTEPAADEAAAADAATGEAPAEAGAAAEAAQPEATVDPGTEILAEPEIEGEAPGTEGQAAVEPGA